MSVRHHGMTDAIRHYSPDPGMRQNVLLLDEPTNNLDPASREEILKAIAKYEGAIVLVTHDEGAVEGLNPEHARRRRRPLE